MRSVDLPQDAEIPEPILERLRALPPINIYRLLAIVPQSVVPWTDLTQAVYECGLDGRLREIGICRQAHAANAAYELHQHRFIARNNGVTAAELEAVVTEPTVTSLDPPANLVCRVADELEERATVSDETFDELYGSFGRQGATELLFILSFYGAVARLSNATRIPIEADNPLQRSASPNAPS
ncbi:MAG: carboxymuconolactone decarboxylase family protein [Candidatus Rokuibacteriota bacterium]|nr:MAG: carboxymuconolactone decarboxylase family protein [Candidatus Rokubacteria bacterium]